MKWIKNKAWKVWKTRKTAFIIVSIVWLMYAIKGYLGHEFNTDILDFVYKAGVWILGFGITLVLSDKAADKLAERRGNYEE